MYNAKAVPSTRKADTLGRRDFIKGVAAFAGLELIALTYKDGHAQDNNQQSKILPFNFIGEWEGTYSSGPEIVKIQQDTENSTKNRNYFTGFKTQGNTNVGKDESTLEIETRNNGKSVYCRLKHSAEGWVQGTFRIIDGDSFQCQTRLGTITYTRKKS
ncbi:hypothetical protein HYX04_05645 [Candidatus Woesearchaeota archaeon]|nr:hypothetical protein [Candidatus Woesearchaeota archaeon]